MSFEWDSQKRAINFEKHGIDFEDVLPVFSDPFALQILDKRQDYGEARYNIIGKVSGVIVCVAFTHREEAVRIISARIAHKKERAAYEQRKSNESRSD